MEVAERAFHGAVRGGILKQMEEKTMVKLRKFRIVADSCPLKKKDCNKCKYSNGYDEKIYCQYGDKDWL